MILSWKLYFWKINLTFLLIAIHIIKKINNKIKLIFRHVLLAFNQHTILNVN